MIKGNLALPDSLFISGRIHIVFGLSVRRRYFKVIPQPYIACTQFRRYNG
ncbi:MAG: hypothetical protein KDA92_09820 [Planctomycetales bacterium]|nr:hypothetical protein [Planctomycetales bacterium]